MGRFLATVLVLVFIALTVNYLTKGRQGQQVAIPGEQEAAADKDPVAADDSAAADDSVAADSGPQLTASSSTPAVAKPAEAAPPTALASDDARAAPQESAGLPAAAVSEPVAEAVSEAGSETVSETGSVQDSPPGEEEVDLFTSQLTSGVAGSGPVTLEEVTAWLTDPRNHAVLKPILPLGLAAGAGQVTGLVENPLTRAKIELGRQLYFDTRLSSDNTISCASCHDPQFGFAKNTQFGIGVDEQQGGRNSPVAYNRILSGPQFWDGRAGSLEEQAVGPIANPIEMGNTHEAVVEMLKDNEVYTAQFQEIFPDGVTIDNVGKAIASFERVLVTGPSPWDHYDKVHKFEQAYADDLEDLDQLKEDDPEFYAEYMALKKASEENPIDESAIRGGELFFSDKAGCSACHVGANLSDEQYHNLGVGMAAAEPDVGRYEVTKDEKDTGAFKTPSIRNVALSAPYMHDGSQQTLKEVVEWYVKGGHPNPYLSEKVKKLELNDQEQADLVAFMNAVTGEFPAVEPGRLPQ